jgi:hypothetical protein
MEKFLLNNEPSKLSISGALFHQMLVHWTDDRDTEVQRFVEIRHNILNSMKNQKDTERLEKIQSFGVDENDLKKRVSLIL